MCGVTDDKIKGLEDSLTPSAKKLEAVLKGLKDPETRESVDTRSTESFDFEVEDSKAIELLDHIDRVGNEESYQAKLDRYLSVCDSRIGIRNYKSLPITERIAAYKAIKGVSFSYYSYQIVIKVDKGDNSEVVYINSKKHKRLTKISESDAKTKVSDFISVWLGNQNSSNGPKKEANTPEGGLAANPQQG
jgi:hypothetical protein